MNGKLPITTSELRDYLRAKDWLEVEKDSMPDFAVFRKPDLTKWQLVIPLTVDYEDGDAYLLRLIQELADVYHTEPSRILSEIGEVHQEVLNFRYHSEQFEPEDMSFQNTADILNGIIKMIASASAGVRHLRSFHPRLNQGEVLDLLRQCRFRHTQQGSFIYKVACPVHIPKILFKDESDLPFVRKAFINIAKATQELVSAMDTQKEVELIERVRANDSPVSYNFCEGLTTILDTDDRLKLDMGIQWAYAKSGTPVGLNNKFTFTYDDIRRIEGIKLSLRPITDPRVDLFYGTVEELRGEMGLNGQRCGEVILSLHIDNESVNVIADLDAIQYENAGKAHLKYNTYICIKGILKTTGRQPYRIESVEAFEIVPK